MLHKCPRIRETKKNHRNEYFLWYRNFLPKHFFSLSLFLLAGWSSRHRAFPNLDNCFWVQSATPHCCNTLLPKKRRRQENLIHACGPVQQKLQAECTPQSQNCNHFYIYHFMVGLSHKKEIQQWFLVSPEFFNNSTKRKRGKITDLVANSDKPS